MTKMVQRKALGLATFVLAATAGTGAPESSRQGRVDVGVAESPSPIEPDDTVFADDVIAQRLCVGLPCANGEAFSTSDLLIKEDTPELRFEHRPSAGIDRDWVLSGDSTLFRLRDATFGTTPFSVRNNAPTFSLNIFLDGTVAVGGGVGSSVVSTLQVRRSDGTTKLLVEEASTTNVGRNMLHFRNNGAATFKFENTSDSTQWNFGTRNAGDFFIAFGGGLPLEFLFAQNGDMTIAGALTQGSDRNSKQEIAAIDPQQVLDKVAALPVSTWSYKASPDVRHMGPMAQDFAAAFGLGADDKHIAPIDVGGVTLAAIQALNAKVQSLEERLRERDRQIDALLARLQSAETRPSSRLLLR